MSPDHPAPAAFTEVMNRAARYFDGEYADYDVDIPVLQAYAARTGGPLLELGCGTGRLLVPLAQAGYDVTGVDLSPTMLARARDRAEAARVAGRVTLIEGDYTNAALAGPYRLAFVVMNTFLHLPDNEAHLAALAHWHAHLAPRGLLLIDVFHPDVAQLAGADGRLEWWKSWRDEETGNEVVKYMARRVDLAEQVMHVHAYYEEVEPDGRVCRTMTPFDLRYVWRYEMELLLKKAGFRLEALYGDWDMAPFADESDRMIFVAQRRG